MPPQAVELGLKRLNSLFDFLEHWLSLSGVRGNVNSCELDSELDNGHD